jgi:hypothetical protein
MGHSYYDGWNTGPKRDEARVIAPETPPHRAKKDRRRWCKGKVGVEHVPVVQDSKNWTFMVNKFGTDHPLVKCHWEPCHRWRMFSNGRRWVHTENDGIWSCHHERACANCGKILECFGVGRDCPQWVPKPDELPCECYSCTGVRRYARRS